MEKFLYVLLGITIWQLITFVVLIVTNEDDDKTIITGCGLPLIIFNSGIFVLKFIRKIYIRKYYVLAHIRNEKGADGKEVFINNVRVRRNQLQNYYTKGENKYYIEQFESENNSIEYHENIKKVIDNGWYCQEWINKNLVKS
ncbi:MAG: hypothetical protein K0R54_16 [Clostridiaceae bacterium]|jgi:hypothetical protein|nr:hypothetical protein [Clostridiaceae bacterium]